MEENLKLGVFALLALAGFCAAIVTIVLQLAPLKTLKDRRNLLFLSASLTCIFLVIGDRSITSSLILGVAVLVPLYLDYRKARDAESE